MQTPAAVPPTAHPSVAAAIQALPRQCLKQSVAPIILLVKPNPPGPSLHLALSTALILLVFPSFLKKSSCPYCPCPRPTEHQTFARRSGPKRRSLHHLSRALTTGQPLPPGFMATSALRSHGYIVDRLPLLLCASGPCPPTQPSPRKAWPVLFSTLSLTLEQARRKD